jgi:hypothetical protein
MDKRPLPSTASSSHRLHKQSRDDPAQSSLQRDSGGASGSADPQAVDSPVLPVDDDQQSDQATVDYGDGIDELYATHDDAGEDCVVYQTTSGEVTVDRTVGELTPREVDLHWDEVSAAVRKELKSFSDLKVFRIVPKGTTGNCMASRWVLRWKSDNLTGIRTLKARLTVKGYADREGAHLATFAGTASRWSQKLVVAIAVQQGWSLLTADVGAAFLRGLTFRELSSLTGESLRRVSFTPPPHYGDFIRELPGCSQYVESEHELEMDKPVYGLKDAPRAWRKRLHLAMQQLQAESLSTDAAVYIWRTPDNKLDAICSAHVDDLKLAGNSARIDALLKALAGMFGELTICRDSFEHCGILHELQQDGSYRLHQTHFAERLTLMDLSQIPTHQSKQLLTEEQRTAYMSGLGSLAWLVQTRMDVAIYIQALQRAAKSPTVAHLLRLNCVIKWARRKPCFLTYRKLQTERMKVLVCTDAAFRREDTTGLAMRGGFIALAEDCSDTIGGGCNVLEFYSRRQRRVVRSTFGAELNSLADGLEVGKMMAFTLAEIIIPQSTAASLVRLEETGCLPIPLHAVTDCKSLLDALRVDETQVPTEASLIMILCQVKELLRTGTLASLSWVDTRDMAADGLNKGSVSRAALRKLSMTAEWVLQFAVVTHQEKLKIAIPAQLEQPA